jgi:hypothetical protein
MSESTGFSHLSTDPECNCSRFNTRLHPFQRAAAMDPAPSAQVPKPSAPDPGDDSSGSDMQQHWFQSLPHLCRPATAPVPSASAPDPARHRSSSTHLGTCSGQRQDWFRHTTAPLLTRDNSRSSDFSTPSEKLLHAVWFAPTHFRRSAPSRVASVRSQSRRSALQGGDAAIPNRLLLRCRMVLHPPVTPAYA